LVGLQWSGALSKGGATAALLNLETTPQKITLSDTELPPSRVPQPEGSRLDSSAATWTIKEAFSGKVQCTGCSLPQAVEVAPHDVALWVLTPA
jgi:hypothetical protein